MEAAGFDEANVVLGPPQGMREDEVQSLRVWRGNRDVEGLGRVQVVVSCYRLSLADLHEVQRTGRVWLTVLGATMPPVIVEAASPFRNEGGPPVGGPQ